MTTPTNTAATRVLGLAMPLAASQAASPWNVLAYATKLRGRGANVELTSADFASCVANFDRWGREVPVVLYHADTDPTAHPDARKAHAWIVAMRVGAMERDGAPVATLEARFRWVNEATRAAVDCGELAYGSITIVQGGIDEETGAECGSFLWSFSLTNNPALVDLPRIAAEQGAHHLAGGTLPAVVTPPAIPASRGPAALEHCMSTPVMMVLAARLGLSAATEEEALRHVVARAEESAETRRKLGLSANAEAGAVDAKITALHSDAAKVAVLAAENEALKADVAAAHDVAVKEHVEALCADPVMAKSRTALEAFARSDFGAFSKAYPKPAANPAALALGRHVTALGGEKTPAAVDGRTAPARHNDVARERAAALMAANPALTLESALKQASRELRGEKGN